MFDNLNYIMNRHTTNHNISPFDTNPIKELIYGNTSNEARFYSRHKILSSNEQEKDYEYQYDPLKMKELRYKLIPSILTKKDPSLSNSKKEIHSNPSLTILDCQLGFNMLRSKIEKMKKITEKVLKDNFEYRHKDSALYEFKTRMNDRKYKISRIRGQAANLKQTQINFSILKENKIQDCIYNTSKADTSINASTRQNKVFLKEEIPVRLSDVREKESSGFIRQRDSQSIESQCYMDNKDDTGIDIELVTSRLADYITTVMKTNGNNEEYKGRSERRRFTVEDKHFSFKNFLNLSENNMQDEELNDIISPLKNINKMTRHFKKKSLSSMELRSILNRSTVIDYKIPQNEIESTNTSNKNNSANENYVFNTDMFTVNNENSCEVNISGFDFEEIFESGGDNENYKKIAMQRLNYFLEENEKEEKMNEGAKSQNKFSCDKNIMRSYVNNVKIPIKKIRKNFNPEIKKSNNHDEVCKKFKKNPYKFYTDHPSENILKMCDLNSDLSNKSDPNRNNLCPRSQSHKKSKRVNSENNITPFDELTLSEIKEEKTVENIIKLSN